MPRAARRSPDIRNMRRFLAALQFLTLFTVGKGAVEPDDLRRSLGWFPVVGALQGVIALFSWIILSTLLPDSVATAAVLLILALTNGGLHLDGFADTVDGLAGGRTPEDRLRIMKDSATGAIGVVFVVFLILLKFLALEELPMEVKSPAMVLFPVVGRWAIVPLACWAPCARPSGLGAAFSGGSRGALLGATLFTAVATALLLGVLALAILVALWLIIYMASRFFKRKIGGVTGDVLGFQSEAAEALFIVMALAMTNLLTID